MWCLDPFFQFFICFVAVIPDIPLIEGQVNILFAVFLCFDSITDTYDTGDKIIHSLGTSQKIRGIVITVSIVLMQGHVIDLIISLIQNGVFPGTESRHIQVGASAGYGLDCRIHEFHQTGSFSCDSSVFCSCFMTHLPRSVHFISQTPYFDIVRIFVTVFFSQITVISAAFEVTVFQKILGILRSAGSKIDSHHDIASCFFGPVSEFI